MRAKLNNFKFAIERGESSTSSVKCSQLFQRHSPDLLSLFFESFDETIHTFTSVLNLTFMAQEEHEVLISSVGRHHSTVWLFVPRFGPFISKAGEALNMVPLFVKDSSCTNAVAKAAWCYEMYIKSGEVDDPAEVALWRADVGLPELQRPVREAGCAQRQLPPRGPAVRVEVLRKVRAPPAGEGARAEG